MKSNNIHLLRSKYWPVHLSVAYTQRSIDIMCGVAGSKDVLCIDVWFRYRSLVPRLWWRWMVSCKRSELLQAGYIWAPYIPLMSTPTVDLRPRWYSAATRAIKKWVFPFKEGQA